MTDPSGNRVFKVALDGAVTPFAGDGSDNLIHDVEREAFRNGPGLQARFKGPGGIAIDASGTL